MIYGIVGGVGSNKSLWMANMILKRNNKVFTNFNLIGYKNFQRLRYSDIVKKVPVEFKKDGTPKKFEYKVNFEYWNEMMEKEGFDIYIDEIQEVMNSRRSNSNENVVFCKFISQVRKILQQSEKFNFYWSSQRPMAVDNHLRELTHVWVLANKTEMKQVEIKTKTPKGEMMLPLNIATHHYFRNLDELDYYNRTQNDNIPFHSSWFIGNYLYSYYDSYKLITMDDDLV